MPLKYVNGPCQIHGLHHNWTWTGKRWECDRCECIAFDLGRFDTPCLACGHEVDCTLFDQHFCDLCLDACLDTDPNYVPFEEVSE